MSGERIIVRLAGDEVAKWAANHRSSIRLGMAALASGRVIVRACDAPIYRDVEDRGGLGVATLGEDSYVELEVIDVNQRGRADTIRVALELVDLALGGMIVDGVTRLSVELAP